ncbi:MAG: protein kinase [Planctomycetes bacterium]|nr:protein kinase [Planctomycetota bacterium]
MGVVYKAVQESLGRTVALKVFPETFSLDPVRLERFRREARATARIRHPNIVPVYEVGESERIHFYAMQLIEGPSLHQGLAQTRDQAAQGGGKKGSAISDPAYAVGVAERVAELAGGLEEAHAQGLVHRDIKPSNILVSKDGSYVLVDFGLVHDLEAESITGSGQILGTLSYMSPEQVSGRNVDARSDVYSLGVTLFELLTLHRPFEGGSTHEIREAILNQEPPSPRRLNPKLGGDLTTIVLHCLEKNPDRRYSSAGELAADLRQFCRGEPILARPLPWWEQVLRRAWRRKAQLATTTLLVALVSLVAYLAWPKGVISLAVLPFLNEAADPSTEYLSDSIPERLMGMLSSFPNLSVKSRSSVFRYKGQNLDPLAAGRDLRADVVLSGRVAQRGNILMLGLELSDVRENKQLWGTRYDRELSDLMATEDEVCRDIAAQLRVNLQGSIEKRLSKPRTNNPEADKAYRRGRLLWSQFSKKSVEKSIERFQEAIGIDPNFALAHVGLAEAWIALGLFQAPKEVLVNAKGYAERALALDPTLGEAHAALGTIRLYLDWNWEEARRSLENALELNPRCFESFPCYLHSLDILGEINSAEASVERALRFNPESVPLQTELACTAYYAGGYEATTQYALEALELDKGFILAHLQLGRAYEQLGEHERSIETLEKARELTGGEWSDILGELAYSYGRSGKTEQAEAILREMVERKKSAFVDPYPLAFAYLGLGDKEKALAALEEALEVRSQWVPWLKVEPKFFSLRSEPRFQALLERLKL